MNAITTLANKNYFVANLSDRSTSIERFTISSFPPVLRTHRVLVPSFTRKFALTVQRTNGSERIKLALCLGRSPGDYSKRFARFHAVYPPGAIFASLEDFRVPRVLQVGGTSEEAYTVFNINSGPEKGKDEYFYMSIFSGYQDVTRISYQIDLPRDQAVAWVGASNLN